ncbi:MAG: NTP transferase domain-containing protein [Patescibacteria group bacterium]
MTQEQFTNVGAVILAAGQGKRMKSDLPKVLHQLKGKPIVDYVVRVVEGLGIKPTVVVSNTNNLVRDFLGDRVNFAVQTEQLGTGHAVACAESLLKDKVGHIIVLYGDHPYLTSQSVAKLIKIHLDNNDIITMMTAVVPDFEDWRMPFYNFGRIVRDSDGRIAKIVEKKDATAEELEIKEINPAYFCFQADWLWKNLKNLKNNNAQQEYYLTDLVKQAIDDEQKTSSVLINAREALGVNSQEELQLAEAI